MTQALYSISIGLPLIRQGKVRSLYDAGPFYLMVTTDRISAFDSIMPTPIPNKGKILTQLSEFWFRRTESVIHNHFISSLPHSLPTGVQSDQSILRGRSMLVAKTTPIEVECVVRGYMAGSAWGEYQAHGTVSGLPQPDGLQLGSRYPEPIFSPAIKNHDGHDDNISFNQLVDRVGDEVSNRLRDHSVALYNAAQRQLAGTGLILADTKFEFGWLGNQIILIDEALTPDSSRYWDQETMVLGESPPSFDKQILRDYLKRTGATGPTVLPDEIVKKIEAGYLDGFHRMTGQAFNPDNPVSELWPGTIKRVMTPAFDHQSPPTPTLRSDSDAPVNGDS